MSDAAVTRVDRDDREILTWSGFGAAVTALSEQITADSFVPDVVLSIARGGLGLGMGLGYALGVKTHAMVNVEFYTGIDERLAAPVTVAPTPEPADLAGLRVLVVDDVADTGLTLRHVADYYAAHVAETRIAVIYAKPRSIVRPHYRWKTTQAWIEFPWSTAQPSTNPVQPAAPGPLAV